MLKKGVERRDVLRALGEVFRAHGYEGASLTLITEATGLDRTKAHAWAFVRSVDDALWGRAQRDTQFEAIAWEIAHALST